MEFNNLFFILFISKLNHKIRKLIQDPKFFNKKTIQEMK